MKNGTMSVVIEDADRNECLEALKEYREVGKLDKLIKLFERGNNSFIWKSASILYKIT